jgi:phosphoglycolate phosphatase (TIGR01487 family)
MGSSDAFISPRRYGYRAIAVDFDGTLTCGARPQPAVLEQLRLLRDTGLRVILVTGRILSELRHSFAEVDQHFDAIVAENGAVMAVTPRSMSQGDQGLVAPVPVVLEDALVRHGVPVRRGQVLLACDSVYDTVVLTEIHRLGLECQVMYNRASLMILPAGVSKASGLREALSIFSLSAHNVIAIGDAENDHALLRMCGLGVAVANAVPSLKEQADLVTDAEDGNGVIEAVTSEVLGSVQPERWKVEIGFVENGEPFRIASTQTNVLIIGGSNAGKSHTGGMCAEALIAMEYCTLVVDFEGDHAGLGTIPGVLLMGGGRALPEPSEVALLLRHRCGSMVLDLSMLTPDAQERYVETLGPVLAELRDRLGLPHWIVTDEAHRPYGHHAPALHQIAGSGHCLISWSPEQIHPDMLAIIDVVIALPSPKERCSTERDHIAVTDFLRSWLASDQAAASAIEMFHRARSGQAVVVDAAGEKPQLIRLRARRTNHVRHWHKYAKASLPEEKRFRFRGAGSVDTGHEAANLYEFHHILRQAATDVVLHHCRHRDFSRWTLSALQDLILSQRLGETEALADELHTDDKTTGDLMRQRLLADIEKRYLTSHE